MEKMIKMENRKNRLTALSHVSRNQCNGKNFQTDVFNVETLVFRK